MTDRGPDFIGIGAARSGTTWLAAKLGSSAEVWLPRRKELQYFTRSTKYPSPSQFADDRFLRRLFGREEHNQRFRERLVRALGHNVRHPSWSELRWDMRYFFGTCSDDWYKSLFAWNADQITGEITPAYALLDDDDVRRVAELLPHVRVVYIMRDPVERAWSTIRYHEMRGFSGALTSLPEPKVIEYLSQPGLVARSDYGAVIRRWTRFVGADRLALAYYEEISQSPQALLRRLLKFVGVRDIDSVVERMSAQRVNESIERDLPPHIERVLAAQYLEMLRDLNTVVESPHARAWQARAEAALA